LNLSPIQTRLYDALRNRPRTADELRDIAWSDDPDGGAVSWKCIYRHIFVLNQKLKAHGMVARRTWRAPFQPYRLVQL
jgi:hypothetical protein